MKTTFVKYLKNKSKKKIKLHQAQLNMAKQPQIT